MKLSKRVNVILLPVILGVFMLAGGLSYHAFRQQANEVLINNISRELLFLKQDVQQAQRATRASAINMLNNGEVINFLNANNPEYQAFAFEMRLYSLLAQAKEYSPGLEIIQLLGSDGELLISADGRDPFAEPELAVNQELLSNPNRRQKSTEGAPLSQHEFVYQSASGALKYCFLKPFSPRLLLDDVSLNQESQYFLFLAVSSLPMFEGFKLRMQKELSDEIALRVTPLVKGPQLENGIQKVVKPDGDVLLSLTDLNYRIDLLLPASIFSRQLLGLHLKIILLMAGLTLFSFFTLQMLIRRQLVLPINRLIEQIKHSRRQANFTLHKLDRQDEVSELTTPTWSCLPTRRW